MNFTKKRFFKKKGIKLLKLKRKKGRKKKDEDKKDDSSKTKVHTKYSTHNINIKINGKTRKIKRIREKA